MHFFKIVLLLFILPPVPEFGLLARRHAVIGGSDAAVEVLSF